MDGQLQQIGLRWQLRYIRSLPHACEKVWAALTEPDHLAAWFPTEVHGDRTEGAKLRFAFPNGEAPDFYGELLTYEPPTVLEYQWGDDTLRFELRPEGDGCVLTFLDTFVELGKAARDAAGWHVCLDALAADLSGDPSARDRLDGWKKVHDGYVATLGPEASTIGP